MIKITTCSPNMFVRLYSNQLSRDGSLESLLSWLLYNLTNMLSRGDVRVLRSGYYGTKIGNCQIKKEKAGFAQI